MTQCELDRAVAEATGENLRVIRQLGFTLADPVFVEHDPEPLNGHNVGDLDGNSADPLAEAEARAIDWDDYDRRRNVPVVAPRRRRPVWV